MKKLLYFALSGAIAFGAEEVEFDAIQINATQYRLDDLNRNVFLVDSKTIEDKGFYSTKQVFNSLPFVSFSNVGLGQNVDLRGQGTSANVNTQILLNGVGLNMLDSSHGVTPLNSVGVSEIESIEVLPGGGAVMYGNGTRGGVINITTKKRYQSLSANAGLGYSYSHGSSAKAHMKIGGKIGEGIYYSLSGHYLFKEGYRDKDLGHLGGVSGNLTWDFLSNHSISLDLGYFKAEEKSTPYLRFTQISNPSKIDRNKAGDGEITTLQDRISTALIYDYKINDSHKLSFKTFFHYYDLRYKNNLQIMNYTYKGFYLPKTQINQKGSNFLDSKIGFQARYDYNHKNGLLIVGFDSIYNQGERNLNLDIDWKGNIDMVLMKVKSYKHLINTSINAKKWSNSLYALERYDFNPSFSLTGGGRYEFAWYGGYRKFKGDMKVGMQKSVITSLASSLFSFFTEKKVIPDQITSQTILFIKIFQILHTTLH